MPPRQTSSSPRLHPWWGEPTWVSAVHLQDEGRKVETKQKNGINTQTQPRIIYDRYKKRQDSNCELALKKMSCLIESGANRPPGQESETLLESA